MEVASFGVLVSVSAVLGGCFHSVQVPGGVERRAFDKYDPMALPERSEPKPTQWPSANAPMIRSDVVVVDRRGGRTLHRDARAQRDGGMVLVDHGPGWPPLHEYRVDELRFVYVDRVLVDEGVVTRKKFDPASTAMAVLFGIVGAGFAMFLLEDELIME